MRARIRLVPLLLWAMALVLAHAAGFRMQVPWDFWQLLDRAALADHPGTSLLLLHSQPPGLNALLALLVAVADATGARVETLAGVLFDVLGLVASLAMFDLGRRVTGSVVLAALGVAALLADPAFHMLGHLFFYTFPVTVLLLLALAAAERFLAHGSRCTLWTVVACLALIVLTRSLYHAAWALAFLSLVVLLRRFALGDRDGTRRRRVAGPFAALALACLAWPVKNLCVFGEAVNTSWMGYYTSLGLPVRDDALERYVEHGEVPEATAARIAELAGRFGAERIDVIASTEKADGSRNWNHLVFLETSDALLARSLAWRRNHPGAFLRHAATRFVGLGRPAYVHPYDGERLLPPAVDGSLWVRAGERVLFADLRPALERLLPGGALAGAAVVRGRPLALTLFGAVLLPGTLAVAAVSLWRRRRSFGAREGTLSLALVTVAWVLLACLMLTEEGNRVRYPATPLVVLCALFLCANGLERVRRGASPPAA